VTSRDSTSLLRLNEEAAPPKSASDHLLVLAYGAIGWPWLVKSLYGGTKKGKAALIKRMGLAPDALPNLGSWKADVGLLDTLADHILDKKPETIVELGAGASSLIMAKALQMNGRGRLISYDQHADFVHATQQWLRDNGLESEMHHAPLVTPPGGWPGRWYQLSGLPETIDLLVIDGPPWAIHPFVRGAAESLFDRMTIGGAVLLDDAARPGERVVARRWRRKWPNFRFELTHPGTKGTLVGTRLR
jgi:predicted O-methyltransferase YrrM